MLGKFKGDFNIDVKRGKGRKKGGRVDELDNVIGAGNPFSAR